MDRTPAGISRQVTTNESATVIALDPRNVTDRTWTTSVNGNTWTQHYDRATGQMTMTSPLNRQSTSLLDGQGRVTNSQVSGIAPVTYAYDGRGRLSSVTQTDGMTVRSITFTYNTDRKSVV